MKKILFFYILLTASYAQAGKEDFEVVVSEMRDPRGQSPTTPRDNSDPKGSDVEKKTKASANSLLDSPMRRKKQIFSRSSIDIVTGELPLVVIEHDPVIKDMKQRRDEFIEMFNNLSVQEKTKILTQGFFNDPKTGLLREEFRDLTYQERTDLFDKGIIK